MVNSMEFFDVPDRKKSFYQKQKLVDFKKIWFFHDGITKSRRKIRHAISCFF